MKKKKRKKYKYKYKYLCASIEDLEASGLSISGSNLSLSQPIFPQSVSSRLVKIQNISKLYPKSCPQLQTTCKTNIINITVKNLIGDSCILSRTDESDFSEFLDKVPFIPKNDTDNVTKLKSFCKLCSDGTPGIFSKRIVKSESYILVGGSDVYMSVCRKHFLE